MWLLDCDGDLFQRRRLWLKPGTKHLLGRNKPAPDALADPEHHSHVIENKSVSRKHLIIFVGLVKPGSGSKLHQKSPLTITDDSKIGTYLDGERFRQGSKELTKNEHEIKLGSYEQVFRIRWHPVVFTFTNVAKELKHSQDPLAPARARLEPLDIKIILEYVVNQTSHVVSHKRNTAKGLQALINAKYIVTEAFVEAVERAASSTPNPEEPDNPLPSPLEADFDKNWPDAALYLPPAGKEPVPRPPQTFMPNPDRSEVFSGYTFVFCDQVQFDNLQPPITNGGGKALIYRLVMGQTTVDEFVEYAKSVAGQKGLGNFDETGYGGKGVVVVRFSGARNFEDWAVDFQTQVDLRLDQRSLLQNEFLDAILINNASGLRKRLEEEVVNGSSAPLPPARTGASAANVPSSHRAETVQTPSSLSAGGPQASIPSQTSDSMLARRRIRRAVTESRFKGFDDFDPSQLPKTKPNHEEDSVIDVIGEEEEQPFQPSTSRTSGPSQSQHHSVHQTQDTTELTRKRRNPPSPDPEDSDEVVNTLLPAAAAMKRRRRLEEQRNNNTSTSIERSQSMAKDMPASPPPKSRKKAKEVDVLEAARTHREAEDAAAQADAEDLEHALADMDIESLRDLVQVEEMEVLPRHDRAPQANGDRWDERWNGRKNFKKFRRKGEGVLIRGSKVIVGLEEVPRRGFGIGEEYWLNGGSRHGASQSQKSKGSTRSQSQAATPQSQMTGRTKEEREEGGVFRRRGARTRAVAEENGEPEDDTVVPEEIIEPTRNPKLAEKAHETAEREAEAQKDLKGKRAAMEPAPAKPPPAKRIRGVAGWDEESEGSGDELKFRFRRRR